MYSRCGITNRSRNLLQKRLKSSSTSTSASQDNYKTNYKSGGATFSGDKKHLNEYLKSRSDKYKNELPKLDPIDLKPLYEQHGRLEEKEVYDLTKENPRRRRYDNRGVRFGYGVRKYEYQHMQRTLLDQPSAIEKLALLNPHERDWNGPEKRHWQPFQPPLVRPRKAWLLPLAPKAYDSLPFYKYVTKTELIEEWPDHYYKDVKLSDEAEKALMNTLMEQIAIEYHLKEHELDTDTPLTRRQKNRDYVHRLANALVDHVLFNHSAGREHLEESAVSRSCKLDAFWIRGGFQPLYYNTPQWRYASKMTGDVRTKRGELAFRLGESPAAILRTPMPLAPVEEEPENTYFPITHDQIYYPQMYSIFADTEPLGMTAGFEMSTEEHNEFVHTQFLDMSPVQENAYRWDLGDADQDVLDESQLAGGMAAAFSAAVAQAHALGFNQWNDLTYPIVTQAVLTDGLNWCFVVYQLNTLNLAHDWAEVETIDRIHGLYGAKPEGDELQKLEDTMIKKNVCWTSGPHQLFEKDDKNNDRLFDWSKTISHILLKMLLKPTQTFDDAVLRPNIRSRLPQNQLYHFEEVGWNQNWHRWIGGRMGAYVSETTPPVDYGKRRWR